MLRAQGFILHPLCLQDFRFFTTKFGRKASVYADVVSGLCLESTENCRTRVPETTVICQCHRNVMRQQCQRAPFATANALSDTTGWLHCGVG